MLKLSHTVPLQENPPHQVIEIQGDLMQWQTHIGSDPRILGGKPIVLGTRLAVDFLLGLLAEGWTEEQILENYPALSPEALRALFGFAAESLSLDTHQK